jgi:hypothetical protein
MEVSMGQRRVVTTNFDTVAMTCYCPGQHCAYKIEGGGGTRTGREAILLMDQAYPLCWEATGVRRCMKVIRIKHGMLLELANLAIFFNKLGGGRYKRIEKLTAIVGEHVVYTPPPHFFGAGCKDQMTIRLAVEVGAWAVG